MSDMPSPSPPPLPPMDTPHKHMSCQKVEAKSSNIDRA
jgi:hypothetical protein